MRQLDEYFGSLAVGALLLTLSVPVAASEPDDRSIIPDPRGLDVTLGFGVRGNVASGSVNALLEAEGYSAVQPVVPSAALAFRVAFKRLVFGFSYRASGWDPDFLPEDMGDVSISSDHFGMDFGYLALDRSGIRLTVVTGLMGGVTNIEVDLNSGREPVSFTEELRRLDDNVNLTVGTFGVRNALALDFAPPDSAAMVGLRFDVQTEGVVSWRRNGGFIEDGPTAPTSGVGFYLVAGVNLASFDADDGE